MRTNLLRSFAIALGLGVCSTTQAQYSTHSNAGAYQAPAKWNNFNAPISADAFLAAVADDRGQGAIGEAVGGAAELPAPIPVADHGLQQALPGAIGSEQIPDQSPYAAALDGSCCEPACRPPLARWFGGSNLLFMTLENSGSYNLSALDATGASLMNTSVVDPSATTGFEFYAGRYLHGNRFGLSFGYMLLDPTRQEVLDIAPNAGDYLATVPAWNGISVNPGTGLDTVYNHFDGAAAYRVRRDLRFQGVEVNLSSFGIMGASRVSDCGLACQIGRKFGWGHRSNCKGYGGAASPIARACTSRVQVVATHGFRWFQVDDEFEFAANINSVGGYQADDLYYNVDTENNLYGYQFGGRLIYALSCRWNLSIGGKFGLYGNDVEYRQRVGTLSTVAYRTGAPADLVDTKDTDTVFSTLGELDLGLGYRISNAWTVRGGYRLMGITGIAAATDQFASNYSSIAASSAVSADDSILLHGGYAGLEYNW